MKDKTDAWTDLNLHLEHISEERSLTIWPVNFMLKRLISGCIYTYNELKIRLKVFTLQIRRKKKKLEEMDIHQTIGHHFSRRINFGNWKWLLLYLNSIWNGGYSKNEEFAPCRSKFFSLKIVPNLLGEICFPGQNCPPWKKYVLPLNK